MGAFYGSILIKSKDVVRIRTVLEAVAKDSARKFLVGPPLKGWVSVFPSDHGQDITISASIAEQFSADIFQLMVHDDDIFAYHFYRNGRLTDQYNSCPDYFGGVSEREKQEQRGQPEAFSDLLVNRSNLAKIKELLGEEKSDKFVFEHARMQEFTRLVGLPNAVSSYEYLQEGERDGIQGWKNFIHVPDLKAEKEAKRRAKLELKAAKKRLQDEGLFLSELLPPGSKKQAIHAYVHCCADTLRGGFLVCWGSAFDQISRIPLLSFNPLVSKIPVESGLMFDERYVSFEMSRSGKWFAASHGKVQVWNWEQSNIAFEIEHPTFVSSLGFDQHERNLIIADSDKIIIFSLETGRKAYEFEIGSGGRGGAALHPDGVYLVVKNRNNLSLVNLETRQIEKTLVCKGTMALDLPPREEIEEMVKGIKKIQADETVNELSSRMERMIPGSALVGRKLLIPITEGMMKFGFNRQGDILFCGTNKGVRAFKWSELMLAGNETPKPVYSASCPTEDPNGAYVQDFFLDESRNQLLFCGHYGKICYLNLLTGKSGILLELPDKLWITGMALSKEGIALGCICRPCFDDRNREVSRLQFWNYPALCQRAGLE